MELGRNRRALREATSAQHAEIDRLVGDFLSAGEYCVYVRGIHAFRSAVEGADSGNGEWSPTRIADETRRDLHDLHLVSCVHAFAPTPLTHSARIGRGYVLEGSGLGARVLLKSARELGFSEVYGARHLWRQANAHANWRALLCELESNDIDIDAAINEAVLTFGHAHTAMTQAAQKA